MTKKLRVPTANGGLITPPQIHKSLLDLSLSEKIHHFLTPSLVSPHVLLATCSQRATPPVYVLHILNLSTTALVAIRPANLEQPFGGGCMEHVEKSRI